MTEKLILLKFINKITSILLVGKTNIIKQIYYFRKILNFAVLHLCFI